MPIYIVIEAPDSDGEGGSGEVIEPGQNEEIQG